MKTAGIIAEYNPFHNGHLYQIEETRRITGADFIIVVMSPDFVQRGEPAIADRYSRAGIALKCGADLCLSLPICAAVGSAEYFAEAGVRILDSIGVTDYISFGCETEVPDSLDTVIRVLNEEPPAFRKLLTDQLKTGLPYPSAREAALKNFPGTGPAFRDDAVHTWLSAPNCSLGLEYMRALQRIHSPIKPISVLRKGSGYHETLSGSEFPSASGIRKHLSEAGPDEVIRSGMPKEAYEALFSAPLCDAHNDAYDRLLHYRLLTEPDLTVYLDVTEDLAKRIKNLLPEYSDALSFAQLLKTKQLTLTRIRRALLHIFLGITKETAVRFHHSDDLYAHILGFRREAAPLLHAIRKSSRIPLISRASDAHKVLSPMAKSFFDLDLQSASLYQLLLPAEISGGKKLRSEYTRSPIII